MALNGKKKINKNETDVPISQRYQNIKKNSELLKLAKQRAHSIVLSLLEVKICKEYLAKNIVYLSRENFDDVAIERCLIGLCGYVLCDQPSSDLKLKNQTYVIRNNKVYDVTKRKNFCSNKCYHAFELLLHQIPTTPLYVRTEDSEIRNMKIIIPVLENLKGKFGKRVDITGTSFGIEDLELDEFEINSNDRLSPASLEGDRETYTPVQSSPTFDEDQETRVNVESSPTPSEEDRETYCTPQSSPTPYNDDSKPKKNNSLSTKENRDANSSNTLTKMFSNSDIIFNENESSYNGISQTKLTNEIQNLSLDSVNMEPKTEDRKFSQSEQNFFPHESHLDDILEIERVLREWITFESLRLILGDVYVKGMLKHLGEIWEHYDRSSDMQFPRLDMKAKYIALCKKLNRQEMKERLEEAQVEVDEGVLINEPLKPMPDYSRLKRDVEQSSLKVKAFYEGVEEYVTKKEVLDVIEEEGQDNSDMSKSNKKAKKLSKQKENDDDKVITLPLIDKYDKITWRRQIVFEKLWKRLAEFAADFGLEGREIRKLSVPLIETFDLTAKNICFKTSQWKFIALVIIKMLSVRYPIIGKAFLPTEKSFSMMANYMRTMGLDEHYLERLLSYITDVSYILAKTEKIVNLESDFEDCSEATEREKVLDKAQAKFLKSVLPCTDQEELD